MYSWKELAVGETTVVSYHHKIPIKETSVISYLKDVKNANVSHSVTGNKVKVKSGKHSIEMIWQPEEGRWEVDKASGEGTPHVDTLTDREAVNYVNEIFQEG